MMRWLVVLLSLGLTWAQEQCVCEFDGGPQRDIQPLKNKIQGQDISIIRLAAGIYDLDSRLSKIQDSIAARVQDLDGLDASVSGIEGNGCPPKHFQCGGDNPYCISNLLVCDGSSDCYNKADEQGCDALIGAGTVLKGRKGPDEPGCTRRRAKDMEVRINSARRLSWYQSNIKLKGTVTLTYWGDNAESWSAPIEGVYSFGERGMLMSPTGDERLGLICLFRGSDTSKMECIVRKETSQSICSRFIFNVSR